MYSTPLLLWKELECVTFFVRSVDFRYVALLDVGEIRGRVM